MMLIGAGGGGCPGDTVSGGSGGGSGAVTVWWGSAQHIPDALNVNIGTGGAATVAGGTTTINYRTASATLVTLLTANGGTSGAAGTVTVNGKKVKTLGRGEDYRLEANKLLEYYAGANGLQDATED